MRIVFIGAVDFSYHCLEVILRQGGNVVAVLNPEKQSARSNSDYADLAPLADEYKVPLYRIAKVKDEYTIELIRSLQPDIIFVFGFSQLIPKQLLDIPPMGCVGTHPALLPQNRGRHPLIWALVEGLSESGLTFFYLDEGADNGDILWQKPFPITMDDDANSLYVKIKTLASQGIEEFLPKLQDGTAPRLPQDHSRASYWRKRTEADGLIIWSNSVLSIFNLVRALTHPYLGAHTFIGSERMIVWKSRIRSILAIDTKLPGEIVEETPDGFLVQCGDGILEIFLWEVEHNSQLRIGMQLG